MNLKTFQQKTITELYDLITIRLKEQNKKPIILQAPTGSGKTLMLSKVISNLLLNDDNKCIIWCSTGTGQIHLQAKQQLESYLDIETQLLDLSYTQTHNHIFNNDVLFVNFEKITKSNNENANILTRESETNNLYDLISNTKQKGIKIILITDEAHIGVQNANSKTFQFIKEIEPNVLIQITATSKEEPTIKITRKEVAESGLIKDGVVINKNINKDTINFIDTDLNTIELLLQEAYKLRLQLKNAYLKENLNVNPLVLIQIENTDIGRDRILQIQNILNKKDITFNNQKLKAWLDDKTSKFSLSQEEKENLKKLDDETEFLIFKTAIATGWDCSRSCILIKFRDTKSETFNVQTVGRILRSINGIKYNNELLNKGYVYTNLPITNIIKDDVFFQAETSIIKNYKDDVIINLPTIKRIKTSNDDILDSSFIDSLNDLFKNEIKDKSFNFNQFYKEEIFYEKKVDVDKLDERQSLRARSNNLSISYLDLHKKYKEFIEELIKNTNIKDIYGLIESGLWFCINNSDIIKNYQGLNEVYAFELFILNNKSFIKDVITKTMNTYFKNLNNDPSSEFIKLNEFCFKHEKTYNLFNTKSYNDLELSLYYPYVLPTKNNNINLLEESFSYFLNTFKDEIIWFAKNDDKGLFAIKYFDNAHNEYKLFNPDFIVLFKNGKYGIFDTKAQNNLNFLQDTTNKQKALFNYCKENNVIGGIVVSDYDKNSKQYNQNFKLFIEENYRIYNENIIDNGWQNLSQVIETLK